MSKVQLQGNASGTGIFTIASPNSNIDRTLTLPDNSGTILTQNSQPSFASTIGVGGATPSTSGAGITFPATQNTSSNANTLDDYEEGSYTPTWTGATSGSVTTGVILGQYTKVGNLVTVWVSFVNPSSTALVGDWKISLPFVLSGFSAYFTGNVGYTRYIPAIAGCAQNVVWAANGYNYVHLARNSSTTGETTNQSGTVSADSLLGFTFTYPAAT